MLIALNIIHPNNCVELNNNCQLLNYLVFDNLVIVRLYRIVVTLIIIVVLNFEHHTLGIIQCHSAMVYGSIRRVPTSQIAYWHSNSLNS